jgi:AhpD family alkylhydroperoxidase
MSSESVREKVRDGYSRIAGGGGSGCGSTPTCCGATPVASEDLAKHIGYSAQELAALPEGANLGLSCGNPNALAALQPGEVVLDLGSGGGFDVFIAGRKVGPTGRAIGVDMTPEMLAKARKNITAYRERTGLDNVEFRLGEIEHLPVADGSVDVIISNCVINLSPDKPQVWREIARVLKPGGRVAISDLALLQPLPAAVVESVEALVGCVGGAALVSEIARMASQAGLGEVALAPKSGYVEAMADWQDPLYVEIIRHLPAGTKPSDYVTSLEITAQKPSAPCPGAEAKPSHYSPAVAELVAIGAAIAANCEPCFKYHYDQARKLGVSLDDLRAAVNKAQSVKQAPAQAILKLADRFLDGDLEPRRESDCCPGSTGGVGPVGNECQ